MARFNHNTGWIEVVCGCVYSGKTEELIRRVVQARLANQDVQVFRADPNRYKLSPEIVSHSGLSISATPVINAAGISCALHSDTEMIAVDEVQFLDSDMVPLSELLADRGTRVVLAGLDMDFRGQPFGPMPELLTRAEFIEKRHAVCVLCGGHATRSQRLIDGHPADRNSATIMRGRPATYEPRCRRCHLVTDPSDQNPPSARRGKNRADHCG